MIYRNKKNNKLYLKLLSLKTRMGPVWIDAILYICLYYNKDGMFWVRTAEDFDNSFSKITKSK